MSLFVSFCLFVCFFLSSVLLIEAVRVLPGVFKAGEWGNLSPRERHLSWLLAQERAKVKKIPKATGSFNCIIFRAYYVQALGYPRGYKHKSDTFTREVSQSWTARPSLNATLGDRRWVNGSVTNPQRSQRSPTPRICGGYVPRPVDAWGHGRRPTVYMFFPHIHTMIKLNLQFRHSKRWTVINNKIDHNNTLY